MIKKLCIFLFIIFIGLKSFAFENPFSKQKDTRSRELKYQYEVLKEDEKNKMEGKILNLTPSGYMTVDEYEKMSEYKDRSTLEIDAPHVQTPSDFKYVPKPLYRITKYNDPPGSPELTLGKKLYANRLVNTQGVVSPDFSKMVYSAVYYYTDSASVASDLFVIPLEQDDTNLNKILKANTAKRLPEPILSTDKEITNYASFRTLTPVDFSSDGTKLLAKLKIGSREDGIWQTKIYVYDFNRKLSYDLSEVRDAVVYFWKEYMDLNLDEKRWDIYPLGFSKSEPSRIIVQAFAFTGEVPVFLGTWSVDWKGVQTRLVSFEKNVDLHISQNGYKIIKDGVEAYQTVEKQEKVKKDETKYLKKKYKQERKQQIKEIKEEYEYTVKGLYADYKDEFRDYKKLRSLSGTTESVKLQEAYKQYLIDQTKKDIEKAEKQIEKKRKEIEKIDKTLDKLYEQTGDTSKYIPEEDDGGNSQEEHSGNSIQS